MRSISEAAEAEMAVVNQRQNAEGWNNAASRFYVLRCLCFCLYPLPLTRYPAIPYPTLLYPTTIYFYPLIPMLALYFIYLWQSKGLWAGKPRQLFYFLVCELFCFVVRFLFSFINELDFMHFTQIFAINLNATLFFNACTYISFGLLCISYLSHFNNVPIIEQYIPLLKFVK